jgi:ABC-type glycerol-3-phosphate transport system permease component
MKGIAIFKFIFEHRFRFRIAKMCKALGVSRSGYYAYHSRGESRRSKENKELLKTIKKIHEDSHKIYGAGFIQILIKIYLPLSTPVLATLSLFYAVGRWNGFSDALMYMNRREFYPIQLLLYNILNNTMSVEVATQEGFSAPGLSETLKAATVMSATIPILLVYPWLQRYFISGVTLGAVKE